LIIFVRDLWIMNFCFSKFNQFCEKLFVEEHKISSNHVEVIECRLKAPYGRKSLDLSIFTFESTKDQSFENIIQEPLIDQIFENFIEDELRCLDESTRDALVSHTSKRNC